MDRLQVGSDRDAFLGPSGAVVAKHRAVIARCPQVLTIGAPDRVEVSGDTGALRGEGAAIPLKDGAAAANHPDLAADAPDGAKLGAWIGQGERNLADGAALQAQDAATFDDPDIAVRGREDIGKATCGTAACDSVPDLAVVPNDGAAADRPDVALADCDAVV